MVLLNINSVCSSDLKHERLSYHPWLQATQGCWGGAAVLTIPWNPAPGLHGGLSAQDAPRNDSMQTLISSLSETPFQTPLFLPSFQQLIPSELGALQDVFVTSCPASILG